MDKPTHKQNEQNFDAVGVEFDEKASDVYSKNHEILDGSQDRKTQTSASKIKFRAVFFGLLGMVILVGFLMISMKLLRETKLPSNDGFNQRITKLQIKGNLLHVKTEYIKQILRPLLAGNFLDIDLAQVRQTIKNLAWVREVSVQRIYPDALQVNIEEQQAIAIWNDKSYLNPWGEIFTPKLLKPDLKLISIKGNEGAQRKILNLYVSLRNSIGESQISKVLHSNEGIYRLSLSNGIQVVLGRMHLEQRIKRLSKALDVLSGYSDLISYIDLRYRHGMAIKFMEQADNV